MANESNNIWNVFNEIKTVFHERETEVDLLACALLAGEHCIFLGPPGTGKSAIAKAFIDSCGLNGWEYLFTKMTTDSEVFGGPNVKKLAESGVFERVTTGKMPECQIAICDEIFKANSPILNALLTMLNERKFDNPDRQSVPLEMAIGLSNEMPDGGSSGELGALWDRFVLRTWVQPIQSRTNKKSLLKMVGAPTVTATATLKEIKSAQASAQSIAVPEKALDTLLDIAEKLEAEQIYVSDRRLRKCVKLLKSAAALKQRTEVQLEDFWVLRFCLWNEMEQIPVVDSIVLKASDPDLASARKALGIVVRLDKDLREELSAYDDKSAAQAWANMGTKIIQAQIDSSAVLSDMEKLSQSDRVAACVSQAATVRNGLADLVQELMGKSHGF